MQVSRKFGSWVAKVSKGFWYSLVLYGIYRTLHPNFRLWLEEKHYIYRMVEPRKMHRFEPDLDDGLRSLDRIKTDELDSFRIAIYCEQNHRKILRNPSKLPPPVYFKLKRLLAERKQTVKQSVLYKQQLHDICAYDTDLSVERKNGQLKTLNDALKGIDNEIDMYIKKMRTSARTFPCWHQYLVLGVLSHLKTIVLTETSWQ